MLSRPSLYKNLLGAFHVFLLFRVPLIQAAYAVVL